MIIRKTEKNPKPIPRSIHLLGLLFFVIIFFYLLIVLTHRIWLPLVADFLVLENQPRQSDLIVVATPFRPRFLYALNLFQKGYANQILLVGDTRIKTLWSGKTSTELAKNEAVKLGIPESKFYLKHSTGTRADSQQAKSLMVSLGLKSTLVVSDPYNMRRLTMIFNHVFNGSGLEFTLVPTNQKRDSPDYWWLSPHSFVYVIKEWIKLPMNFYLLNFRTLQETELTKVQKEEPHEKFTEPKLEMDSLFSKEFSHNLIRFIKFKIGAFLVVDDNEINAEAIITPVLSTRASVCYRKGICKKIFLFNGVSDYTRNNMEERKIQNEINNEARKLGIDLNDLKLVPHIIGDGYQTTQFLNRFMRENNLKSVRLFLPYYETRKLQFYFKRYLNPGFTAQIKPLESSYRHLLEQWLQNTGLGNIFLDQYLIMAHYFFNKFLWSSRA